MAHFFFIFHALSFEVNFLSHRSFPEAPVWAKMLVEQMCSVNEEVLDMRKELQLFKIEMNQRVGQVENDVKLQQFQCQTMSRGH